MLDGGCLCGGVRFRIKGKLGPAGVKAAMDAVGLYGGPCRPPLAPVSPPERERVARLLAA